MKLPITSERPFDTGISHHFPVNKNLMHMHGAPTNWRHGLPTVNGFADMRLSIMPLVRYTEALWLASPRCVPNPILELWYPETSPHCTFIVNAIMDRIETRKKDGRVHPAFEVLKRSSASLNSIDPGWAKLPPGRLTPPMQRAVRHFNREYKLWQQGMVDGLPMPPGGTMTPGEHLAQVAAAEWQIQAERVGHFVLQVTTSSTCYAANAVLGVQQPIPRDATHVPYFATKTGYGDVNVYHISSDPPLRRTQAAIHLSELSPALLAGVQPPCVGDGLPTNAPQV